MTKRERIARAKRALKNSELTQGRAAMECGVSLPTFLKVLKEGLIIKDLEKRAATELWIRNNLEEK